MPFYTDAPEGAQDWTPWINKIRAAYTGFNTVRFDSYDTIPTIILGGSMIEINGDLYQWDSDMTIGNTTATTTGLPAYIKLIDDGTNLTAEWTNEIPSLSGGKLRFNPNEIALEYVISATPNNVVSRTFSASLHSFSLGLTTDGINLFTLDFDTQEVNVHSGVSGTINSNWTYHSYGGNALGRGIYYDGGFIYILTNDSSTPPYPLYVDRYNPDGTGRTQVWTSNNGTYQALAVINSDLLLGREHDVIEVYDGFSANIKQTIQTGFNSSDDIVGLAWDGTFLYVANSGDVVRVYNGISSTTNADITLPMLQETSGLTYLNGRLYARGNSSIVEFGSDQAFEKLLIPGNLITTRGATWLA